MYRKGEVVWAKLKGFPYWPATISKVIDNKGRKSVFPGVCNEFVVNFFGENSFATLPENKIHKFEDKLKEFSADVKKKRLIDAIEEAKVLHNTNKNDKTQNLKRKSQAEGEKTQENRDKLMENREKSRQDDSSVDSKALKSGSSSKNSAKRLKTRIFKAEVRKKVKTEEFSPVCERFTRSKAGNKENPVEKVLISAGFQGKSVETPAFPPQKSENPAKTEKNCKTSGFSSVKASVLLRKKGISANSQRNFAVIKKKVLPAALNSSKLLKKAAISAKNGKSFTKLGVKSVSDSTNDGFDESVLIRNLEKKLKYGIEIVTKHALFDKNYAEIIRTINECVGDLNKIFATESSQALVSLLSRNIGKEMALLEKLCEENKEPLNQLFNIEYYVKELRKANGKIESQIYYQFFDCSPLLKELKIPYSPEKLTISEFFANCEKKPKAELLQTPKRNNSQISAKKKSLTEDQSDVSSGNNEENSENLKNLETSRLISKESKESETKNHGHVENRHLRKRICQKMAQILQEKYGLEKNKAQELTLQIEEKIRSGNPEMREEYKEKIRIVLKMMKEKTISVERFMENDVNFECLKLKALESTPGNKSEDDGCAEKFSATKAEKISEFL